MQKHLLMNTSPHIEMKHITQTTNKGVYVLYYEQIIESTDPIVKALQFYFKSRELVKDINSVKQVIIYSLNEDDPFTYIILQLATTAREDGAILARKACNKIVTQKSEDNSMSKLLPHNYTIHDIAEFNFGFQLANYRWTYQSIKEGGKPSQIPIHYLYLITQIKQEDYLTEIEQKWNLKQQENRINYQFTPFRETYIKITRISSNETKHSHNRIYEEFHLRYVKGFGDKGISTIIEGDELLTAG
ncbi:unnamed protein product [Paramecium sonneborni]|uniref:Uncharacterized protein n=1 Tax=Paramecium sonneborni TaxID=65129 RepID=A0A8S1RBD5_9CILI|nr:unnamed protein product [Paramecium sonneborni]